MDMSLHGNRLGAVLPLIVDEFFLNDDTEHGIAVMNEGYVPVAALFLKERLQHFRLGHIANYDDWIDRYLETDFHQRFRYVREVSVTH